MVSEAIPTVECFFRTLVEIHDAKLFTQKQTITHFSPFLTKLFHSDAATSSADV